MKCVKLWNVSILLLSECKIICSKLSMLCLTSMSQCYGDSTFRACFWSDTMCSTVFKPTRFSPVEIGNISFRFHRSPSLCVIGCPTLMGVTCLWLSPCIQVNISLPLEPDSKSPLRTLSIFISWLIFHVRTVFLILTCLRFECLISCEPSFD